MCKYPSFFEFSSVIRSQRVLSREFSLSALNPKSKHYVTLATPRVVPVRRAKAFTWRKVVPLARFTLRTEVGQLAHPSCLAPRDGLAIIMETAGSILERNKLRACSFGIKPNKNNWNASKRLFGSYSHSGVPGFPLRLFCYQGQNSRNIFWNIFLFLNIPNERDLIVTSARVALRKGCLGCPRLYKWGLRDKYQNSRKELFQKSQKDKVLVMFSLALS